MQKRILLEQKYNNGRNNLMLVVIFTFVNVVLQLLDAGMYFLFSASFPLLSVEFGRALSIRMFNDAYLVLGIVLAFVAIACYAALFFLSKKHRVCILIALILFCVDTLFLFWLLSLGFEASMVLDILFHVWVLFSLISGVKAWADLKKVPADEPLEPLPAATERAPMQPSSPIRAGSDKGKVILAQNVQNLLIVVKRVRGTTELLVNGWVYAESSRYAGNVYELNALVADNLITVTDVSGVMSLFVNGYLVEQKRRYF